MTSAGRSFNEVTDYVKKVEGVRRDGQAKAWAKRAKNSGLLSRFLFQGVRKTNACSQANSIRYARLYSSLSRECRFGAGFYRSGRCSGVVAVVAGSTRIKVVNKPLNDLIMHFSIFRAKEQTLGDSYSFFTIIEAKYQEQAERIRKGKDQVS
uniref:Uncharacterized protein n=1 Tax=Solanum tuberosum TaxID=4113 RepID=M1DTU6_SOLTU